MEQQLLEYIESLQEEIDRMVWNHRVEQTWRPFHTHMTRDNFQPGIYIFRYGLSNDIFCKTFDTWGDLFFINSILDSQPSAPTLFFRYAGPFDIYSPKTELK